MTRIARSRSALLAFALLAASPVLADEGRPLVGDTVHGEQLVKKAGMTSVKLDGAWINAFSDEAALARLKSGKDGFPRIESRNKLDLYDALAYLRSRNADLRDYTGDADHVLVTKGKLDDNAVQRLKERAGMRSVDADEIPVFVLYKIGEGAGSRLSFVSDKDSKNRDRLKKDAKVGYVVFVPLPGLRKGGYEAALLVDKDIHIKDVEIRAPDGSLPADLNQAADRFIGKGARGQYEALKAGGAGKAVSELQKPLSDAFLLGVEGVYMFEVAEREYFAFD